MRHVRVLLTATALAVVTVLVPLAPSSAAPAPPPTSGTFFWANAWGAHFTAGRRGMGGAERMRRLVRVIGDAHASVGVLVELERPQVRAFRRALPGFRLALADGGTTEGVFWDGTRYAWVANRRFRSVTYGGRRMPVLVTVLRDRANGRLLGVMAVHNSADRWRHRALTRELREVAALRQTYGDRLTVLVAGDFNAGRTVACRSLRAGLYSVARRRCAPSPIDQLLVDRDVAVDGYRALTGHRIRRITDHRAVYRARFTVR